MNGTIIKNLIEFIKFMIKQMEDNTSVKRKAISNMDKENTSLKEMALITKDNGETIKWKVKVKLTSKKDNLNTQVNGRLINIMGGVFFTLILPQIQSGFLTKESLKMESNKGVDKSSSKMVSFMMVSSEEIRSMEEER